MGRISFLAQSNAKLWKRISFFNDKLNKDKMNPGSFSNQFQAQVHTFNAEVFKVNFEGKDMRAS